MLLFYFVLLVLHDRVFPDAVKERQPSYVVVLRAEHLYDCFALGICQLHKDNLKNNALVGSYDILVSSTLWPCYIYNGG